MTNWDEFWRNRWNKNEIGFHQSDYEPLLVKYFPKLSPTTVLVPLCGKTKDMLYLTQQGHRVIGVELSEMACEAFFQENQIEYRIEKLDSFNVYRSKSIDIFCGDFFQLQSKHVTDVTFVFDRAALIALPPELRQRYTSHLKSIFQGRLPQILLIVIAYKQEEMKGPPFSVPDSEVKSLYQPQFKIETLSEEPDEFVLRSGGKVQIFERAYFIKT